MWLRHILNLIFFVEQGLLGKGEPSHGKQKMAVRAKFEKLKGGKYSHGGAKLLGGEEG